MRSRGLLLGLAAAASLLLLVFLAASSGAGNRPTTKSTLGRGYYAAFHYLQRQAAPVISWEQELDTLPETPGLLIIASPITSAFTRNDGYAVRGWLARGGHLILLHSGGTPTPGETALFDAFKLHAAQIRHEAPWAFPQWIEWKRAEQTLEPVGESIHAHPRAKTGTRDLTTLTLPDRAHPRARTGAGKSLRFRWQAHDRAHPRAKVGTYAIQSPGEARVLYQDAEGTPAVFAFGVARGDIVVVNNSSILSNRLLREGSNLEFLEELIEEFTPAGGAIYFDEWHHGHRAASAEARRSILGPFEMLALHLAFLYFVAVWTLSRPFGPRPEAAPGHAGSTSRWLLSLASLHRRNSHAEQAGQLLLKSARQLARSRHKTLPDDLPEHFSGGNQQLLALARTIGRWQQEKKL